MRMISVGAILAGVVASTIGLVSRIRVAPIFGLDSRIFAGITIILFLFAIAVNTLPEDL